ncbi:Endoribonuclease L-PSP/chorismate mutase-like protein [Hyaloraphidium curvatum]|nr:Endoribonuclease L-PSP/chorismate mutase-like protein [Hyaloraphidium curvatum]
MSTKDVVVDRSGGTLARHKLRPFHPLTIGTGFALAYRRGPVILLSGHVASDPATGACVGKGDAYKQMRQALSNIEDSLKHYGLGLKDVTRLTIFVVDMGKNFRKVAKAYSDAFKGISPPPANTTVGTTGLVSEEYLVEVQAEVASEGSKL